MRILLVSDLHGSFAAAERVGVKAGEVEAELIVVAGDITHFGDVEDAEVILGKVAAEGLPVFFVSGNCDPTSLLSWRPDNSSIINLHGLSVEFGGRVFLGLGGAVGKIGTLTEFEESEVEEILRKFSAPSPGFVMVSHVPPYGVEADYTGVKHIGSRAVRRFVEERKPVLVMCGHAHEGRAVSRIGETIIVNAGPAKNGYCAVIDVEDEVKAELSTLY